MTMPRLAAIAVLSLLLPLGSCDVNDIVHADTPDIIPPDGLRGVDALPTVRAAALGDFALAFGGSGAEGSGGTEGIILTGGLLADEWVNSETFPTRVEIDRRGPIQSNNGTAEAWFRTLSRARATAEFAVRRFREYAPDTARDARLSEVLSLSAFAYLFFAENYCSGVPFSIANDDATFTYGYPLTTQQMLDTAAARFRAALAAGTALLSTTGRRDTVIWLASVGLGRALLGAGDFAGAAAAVADVPTGFVYRIHHSENTARQNNGVFQANVTHERYSVADLEGANGLPYRSAADPRVLVTRAPANDLGFDQATRQYDQLRYADRRASIPLASGLEGRLIEAEHRLHLGDTAGYLATHNALRGAPPAYIPLAAGAVSLAPLGTGGLTSAQVVRQHFRERAFWLWLTGHRLWDMRRLARHPGALPGGGYGFTVDSVFPRGSYFKGSFTYGPDVNLPVPYDEENNPNFSQCFDRNP